MGQSITPPANACSPKYARRSASSSSFYNNSTSRNSQLSQREFANKLSLNTFIKPIQPIFNKNQIEERKHIQNTLNSNHNILSVSEEMRRTKKTSSNNQIHPLQEQIQRNKIQNSPRIELSPPSPHFFQINPSEKQSKVNPLINQFSYTSYLQEQNKRSSKLYPNNDNSISFSKNKKSKKNTFNQDFQSKINLQRVLQFQNLEVQNQENNQLQQNQQQNYQIAKNDKKYSMQRQSNFHKKELKNKQKNCINIIFNDYEIHQKINEDHKISEEIDKNEKEKHKKVSRVSDNILRLKQRLSFKAISQSFRENELKSSIKSLSQSFRSLRNSDSIQKTLITNNPKEEKPSKLLESKSAQKQSKKYFNLTKNQENELKKKIKPNIQKQENSTKLAKKNHKNDEVLILKTENVEKHSNYGIEEYNRLKLKSNVKLLSNNDISLGKIKQSDLSFSNMMKNNHFSKYANKQKSISALDIQLKFSQIDIPKGQVEYKKNYQSTYEQKKQSENYQGISIQEYEFYYQSKGKKMKKNTVKQQLKKQKNNNLKQIQLLKQTLINSNKLGREKYLKNNTKNQIQIKQNSSNIIQNSTLKYNELIGNFQQYMIKDKQRKNMQNSKASSKIRQSNISLKKRYHSSEHSYHKSKLLIF